MRRNRSYFYYVCTFSALQIAFAVAVLCIGDLVDYIRGPRDRLMSGWILASVLLIYSSVPCGAMWALIYFHNVTKRKPGHCRKCDYDLHGNVSGVCPECGTPTGTSATATQNRV